MLAKVMICSNKKDFCRPHRILLYIQRTYGSVQTGIRPARIKSGDRSADLGEIPMKKGKTSIGIVILLIIFLYFSYIAVNQQKIIYAKNLELSRLEDKIAGEQLINEELKKQSEMIQSDEYVEKIAREKLGMVKKNERVYVDIGN